ncbi:hypothetical protein GOQ29_04165 [Clostridium sp. D2Q-14]|uniref:hypothetical protein n=1 Tax=Anaeromonas gelatinilytica TaxID=2683194 RepID=UPI00193BBD24|nr:hypothetical protein [Anaeromonas gelatinilytica]MBS4534808.1 hypothetical protein [Anaeromonas gelatinilytica]
MNIEYLLLINPLIIISILTICYKENRKRKNEVLLFGSEIRNSKKILLNNIILGILMGIMTSLLIKYFNIKIDVYILLVYIVSLMLSLINKRFLCIVYGGSIVSIVFCLTDNIDKSINILYLIGIFHLIEGILIYLDGYRNRSPMYLERKGIIMAGYYFDLLWLLPIIVNINGNIIILPLILGFRNLISSGKVKKRINKYGINSFIYGITNVFFISLVYPNKGLVILLSISLIIEHELIIRYNTKNYEDTKYLNTKRGVKVLDVIDENNLLHPLDIIVEINNCKVNDVNDIKKIISKYDKFYSIKYIDNDNKIRNISMSSYRLNIIPLINTPPIIANYIKK